MPNTDLEIRNIYPGEAVFADDYVLRRVQTFGSTTTFNNTDVFEIGNYEVVEAIDDVPAVAITCDTNEYATLRNLAIFANRYPDTANYVDHLDYQTALVDMYAPIIRGEYYGLYNSEIAATTLTNGESPIFRTVYLEDAAVNNITATYTTGGLATENFALEGDAKRWFFNDGSNVVVVSGTAASGIGPSGVAGTFYGVSLPSSESWDGSNPAPDSQQQNNGNYALKVLVGDSATSTLTEYTENRVVGNLDDGEYYADATGVYFNESDVDGKYVRVRYIAPSGGMYFSPDASGLAGLRHGQAEVFLFDTITDSHGIRKIRLPDEAYLYGTSGTPFWRLQSATVTVPLGREQLTELGHFRPYARPLTLPVAATVAVESTDHDLELARRLSDMEADTDKEIGLGDFLKDKNLVVKVYKYDDVERSEISALLQANGVTNPYLTSTSGITPSVSGLYGGSAASGITYKGQSVNAQDLYPSKVVCVKKLIPTGEAQSLAVGSNATQTFDFRADNCYWILGAGADGIAAADVPTPVTDKDVLKPYDYSQI